jgi:hypothetical protein
MIAKWLAYFFQFIQLFNHKIRFMPQSNHGGSKRNSPTSKQTGDNQRSSQSEKGKTGQSNQGAQGQKGKEDMEKGKMNKQHEGSNRSRSESEDEE